MVEAVIPSASLTSRTALQGYGDDLVERMKSISLICSSAAAVGPSVHQARLYLQTRGVGLTTRLPANTDEPLKELPGRKRGCDILKLKLKHLVLGGAYITSL